MTIRILSQTLALLIAFAPGVQAAQGLTTDRVVLLMRHGVRPPTHTPPLDPAIAPDKWPVWPVPDGYLTPHGAEAIERLGAYQRRALAARGVLPEAGCPRAGAIEIYADVDERTVKTAEAFATGLAPHCGLSVGHATTAKDPIFSPFDGTDADYDSRSMKAAMLAAAGGDLDRPVSENRALFQKMQDTLEPGGSAFLRLPAKISIKTPGQLPKLSGPIAQGASASEIFLLEYLEGKPMAEVGWGRLGKADVGSLLALHPLAYRMTARPAVIADCAAAPLAARIASRIAGPARLSVLVGHDTNIAGLGGMLGLHWTLGGYPADDPPPGGGIAFTLSHDRIGQQYVTASYQVQTMDQIRDLTTLSPRTPPAMQMLAIPRCGNAATPTACKAAAFLSLLTQESPCFGARSPRRQTPVPQTRPASRSSPG